MIKNMTKNKQTKETNVYSHHIKQEHSENTDVDLRQAAHYPHTAGIPDLES